MNCAIGLSASLVERWQKINLSSNQQKMLGVHDLLSTSETNMVDGITILSTFPFILHVLTAIGGVFEVTSGNKDEVISYWVDASVNCYSLIPTNWLHSHRLAYVQASLAAAAFLTHTSSKLRVRTIGYGVLLLMYGVTQLRLIVWGYGIEVISYLYTHIAIFSILVLYNDSLRPRGTDSLTLKRD